jgi:hypothetical protein
MTALVDMLEKDWQRQVRQLAEHLGYRRAYHTFDSRRSDTGFPDLVLVGHQRVIFLELKREQGKVSAVQAVWISALRDNNAEVYVARPRHLQALATLLGPKDTQAWHEARGLLLLELDTHLAKAAS